MDDQLVIDSSGAWVRKTTQLMAQQQPLLPPKSSGGLPCATDHSVNVASNRCESAFTVYLDQ